MEGIIGEDIGLINRNCNNSNRGYGRGRGSFRRGNFRGRYDSRGRYNNGRGVNRI